VIGVPPKVIARLVGVDADLLLLAPFVIAWAEGALDKLLTNG